MPKKFTRLLLAGAAVGAGSILAAAPAMAAPGDLQVTTAVVCDRSSDKTFRLVAVENVGGAAISGVRGGSVAGPEVVVPALVNDGPPKVVNGVLVGSATGVKKAGTLDGGESFVMSQSFAGCAAPYAILGYAIGDQIDNVISAPNFAFDWGVAPPALMPPAASR